LRKRRSATSSSFRTSPRLQWKKNERYATVGQKRANPI
jgi:hypothetical protein